MAHGPLVCLQIPLKEFSTSELQDLIKKVNDLYDGK